MSEDYWRQPRRWNKKAAAAGERHRVFCASLADVFDADGPVDARRRLWDLIAETPALDWLLLTKRPELAPKMLPPAWLESMPPNVWMGTTVEDQDAAKRIPHLLAIPAIVRFLSIEPLIGPLVLSMPELADWPEKEPTHPLANPDEPDDWRYWSARSRGIHWAIIGGESGPGARPLHLKWVTDLVSQLRVSHVATFVKQLGAVVDISSGAPADWPGTAEFVASTTVGRFRSGPSQALLIPAKEEPAPRTTVRFKDPKGGDPDEWPASLRIRDVPVLPPALLAEAIKGFSQKSSEPSLF